MLRPSSPDLLPASAFSFPSPHSLHGLQQGARCGQQKNASVLLGETGTMGWRGLAAWAVGRGSGWSGEWTVGGGTAELEIWAQVWGCVCVHTHTPPTPKGSRCADSTRVDRPVLSAGSCRPGLRSDLLCVPAVADSQCDFGPGPPSPGLPLRASLSHLYSRD